MKKLISAIPVAVIFSVLVFVFVFMSLPEKQAETTAAFTVDFYFLRTRGFYFAVLGGIFMVGFYHMTIYIFRRRESVYLIFSVFCMMSAFYFIFARGGLNEIFAWIPAGTFLKRFIGILSFLYHNTITVLGLYVLSRRFLLAHRKALAAYIVLGIAYFLFVPVSASFYASVASLVILAVSLFVTVIGFRSPVLRENHWTWLYFISFIFHLCTGISNLVLFVNVFYMLGLVSNLFMVLSQSVLLSKNYTNAFALVEETNENLERIVDERTKALQNTNSAMKELIGNISHDLKTPLAVMSVNLEELLSLTEAREDEALERHVRLAYHKNLDLQRLIANLTEISRIETGQSLLAPEWLPLLGLLEQAQDKYDDLLRSRDIFFEIYCSENAELYADPQRIWSVFDNIIYNAARHTESGGTITISAEVLEKTAVVTITDTGCGIEPAHLPHIFERFYKANAARGGGDSGLGLYIVKTVMEAFGGSVSAASESGKGTSIILTFAKKP